VEEPSGIVSATAGVALDRSTGSITMGTGVGKGLDMDVGAGAGVDVGADTGVGFPGILFSLSGSATFLRFCLSLCIQKRASPANNPISSRIPIAKPAFAPPDSPVEMGLSACGDVAPDATGFTLVDDNSVDAPVAVENRVVVDEKVVCEE
jgi:hypothetical protein